MADLTVLVSPTPLYPQQKPSGFSFVRRSPNVHAVSRPVTPIMITLETAKTPSSAPSSPVSRDDSLLSPPINTWKSRPRHIQAAPRAASAPPSKHSFDLEADQTEESLRLARGAFRRRIQSFTATTKGGELIRPPPPLRELSPQLFFFLPDAYQYF